MKQLRRMCVIATAAIAVGMFWAAAAILIWRLLLTDTEMPFAVEVSLVGWCAVIAWIAVLLVPELWREVRVRFARRRIERSWAKEVARIEQHHRQQRQRAQRT